MRNVADFGSMLSIPRPCRCVCSFPANPHTRASEHEAGGTMPPALRVFLVSSVVSPLPSRTYLHIEPAAARKVLVTSCCLWRAQEMNPNNILHVAKIKNELLDAPTTPQVLDFVAYLKGRARAQNVPPRRDAKKLLKQERPLRCLSGQDCEHSELF